MFHTGDIGELDVEQGTLKILGRKKNIYVLQTGQVFDPDALETIFQSCPCVSQICILGGKKSDHLTAIVVPVQQNNNNLTEQQVLAELQAHANKHQLSEYKIPKRVVLEWNEWSAEQGLLTPSYKTIRTAIATKYNIAL